MPSTFQYTKAVVRKIPNSFPEAALRQEEPSEPIDLEKAREQWRKYVAALKELNLEVVEIPADEGFPDCVFIEDDAVVCDNTALITRPGHITRRGETAEVKKALEKLGLNIVEMVEPAKLDGGDVLFTGQEFFVGLSSRTNKEGVESLKKAFPKYSVSAISVTEGLHLKSMMSMAGPILIVVWEGAAGESAWKEIQEKGKHQYNKLSVPESKAANCLYINGILVHPAAKNIPNSIRILRSLNCRQIEVDFSELVKADGCLTCCSLLIP